MELIARCGFLRSHAKIALIPYNAINLVFFVVKYSTTKFTKVFTNDTREKMSDDWRLIVNNRYVNSGLMVQFHYPKMSFFMMFKALSCWSVIFRLVG